MSTPFKYGEIGENLDPELEFIQDQAQIPQPQPQAQGGNFIYSKLEEADSGPYYVLSPGEQVCTAELAMGFYRIAPAQIQKIEDVRPWVDIRYLENATGEKRESIDPETRRPDGFVEAKYTIYASANRDTLVQSFGPGGLSDLALVHIKCLDKLDSRRFGLSQFNDKILPYTVEPGNVPEKYQKLCATKGGLAVREKLVLEAREFFSSPEFVTQADVPLQRLYLKMIEEILGAFGLYRRFASAYLDKQDHAIKLPDSNEKSKDTYDDRDKLMQWLLAREPVDTALTRALGQGGGLTAEQFEATLEKVSGKPAVAETSEPRAQCPACGERIPLIAGELPPLCRFCKTPTRGAGPQDANVLDPKSAVKKARKN